MGESIAVSIAVVFIAFLIGSMIYRDIVNEKQCREWEAYKESHRHCLPRPYKR